MTQIVVENNPCEINCSILVGKHCAYCMDCGQIYLEYSDKIIIKRLMNPGKMIDG